MDFDALFKQGLQQHKAGKLAEANTLYRQVLAQHPRHADALHLLGVLAGQCERHDVAIDLIGRAISADPRPAVFHLHLAESFQKLGRTEEALAAYRAAGQRNPDADDCREIAAGLKAQSLLAEAETFYRRGAQLRPQDAGAAAELGRVLQEQSKFPAAEEAFRRAVLLAPGSADAAHRLGFVLRSQGKVDEAVQWFRRSTILQPKSAEAAYELATTLTALGALDEAVKEFQKAIDLKADYAEAHCGLGVANRLQGWADDAVAACDEAIKLRPDYAEAHVARGLALMMSGDPVKAWKELDWRRRSAEMGYPNRHSNRMPWNGSDLLDRTLLVHSDGSIEDALQFVRYVPWASRGGHVVVECPFVLQSLLRTVKGVRDVFGPNDPPPPVDLYVPMMTLPLVAMTTPETIPAEIPYVRADETKVEAWRQRLGPAAGGGKRRIGLAWSVDLKTPADRARCCPLEAFAPLAALGADLVSLQTGPAAAEASAAPAGMKVYVAPPGSFRDYADVASLITLMDAVVTVDSPVAHLAAAMGKPTYILLPFVADWRWMIDRDDSPWYPTARLCRQRIRGDWASLLVRVAEALAPPTGAIRG